MTRPVQAQAALPDVTLHVLDRDGGRRAVTAPAGGSLMEALRDQGLDIAAICGGCCSCGTCHVYVADAGGFGILPPTAQERELLELQTALRPESRLSCQIALAPQLDGLCVELAPEV